MPLATSGEVTAFQVVKTFWRQRVTTGSLGHRVVGEDGVAQAAKRLAALHLAERAAEGVLVVPRVPDNAQLDNGVQMLLHEGVLTAQGAHSVRWMHDWLREYALVDWLIGQVGGTEPALLAGHLARWKSERAPHDHVVRSAAIGGAKWITGDAATWGPLEVYLRELKRILPGETGAVLAMLMEGPESSLALEQLPHDLLIEALLFASRLRASQWAAQVMAIPARMFEGREGARLYAAVTEYLVEVGIDE